MHIQNECIPCLIRQAYEVADLLTDDQTLQQKILRYALERLSQITYAESAPYLAMQIHHYICHLTQDPDPYRRYKIQFNEIAEQLVRSMHLREKISQAAAPFDMACRLAIAGNIIDFGLGIELDRKQVEASLHHCLEAPIFGLPSEDLRTRIQSADRIMVITDNAGEIVFDKLLVEQMPRERVTYVVKGGPIVNDATMADAAAVGMTQLVKVIDDGASAQGTLLDLVSDSFLEAFAAADLIIAKGQANFESLGDRTDPRIVFMLKAKCRCVAGAIGCDQGDLVIFQPA